MASFGRYPEDILPSVDRDGAHDLRVPAVSARQPKESGGSRIGKKYVVRKGDTLGEIARASLPPGASKKDIRRTVLKLAELNSIDDPDLISEGATIRVSRSFDLDTLKKAKSARSVGPRERRDLVSRKPAKKRSGVVGEAEAGARSAPRSRAAEFDALAKQNRSLRPPDPIEAAGVAMREGDREKRFSGTVNKGINLYPQAGEKAESLSSVKAFAPSGDLVPGDIVRGGHAATQMANNPALQIGMAALPGALAGLGRGARAPMQRPALPPPGLPNPGVIEASGVWESALPQRSPIGSGTRPPTGHPTRVPEPIGLSPGMAPEIAGSPQIGGPQPIGLLGPGEPPPNPLFDRPPLPRSRSALPTFGHRPTGMAPPPVRVPQESFESFPSGLADTSIPQPSQLRPPIPRAGTANIRPPPMEGQPNLSNSRMGEPFDTIPELFPEPTMQLSPNALPQGGPYVPPSPPQPPPFASPARPGLDPRLAGIAALLGTGGLAGGGFAGYHFGGSAPQAAPFQPPPAFAPGPLSRTQPYLVPHDEEPFAVPRVPTSTVGY